MRGPRNARSRALASLALAVVLALIALPAAAQADSPWWALDTGSRPSNVWAPVSESQELQAAPPSSITAIKIEGEYVACMSESANALLCLFATGKPSIETAAQLQAALEAPIAYGPGGVQVSEDPSSSRRFQIDSVGPMVGRWVPFLETELGGSAKVLKEGGSGRLVLTATNVGTAPTAGTVTFTDELPDGVTAYHAEAYAGFHAIPAPIPCAIETAGEKVSCAIDEKVPSYEAIEVEVWVSVDPNLTGGPGTVSLAGGGAPEEEAPQTLTVSAGEAHFGIQGFSMRAEEKEGNPTTKAGSHPFQLTQLLQFNAGPMSPGERREATVEQPAQPRNVRVKLPPGLVGNPSKIPTCSFKQFTTQDDLVNECAPETAIGAASVTVIEPVLLGFARIAVPVFNLEPAYGEPARLGFMAAGVPVTIDTELRGGEAYAIGANVLDASQLSQVLASTVSIWGTPGDPAHDSSRGWGCLYFTHPGPCEIPSEQSKDPFLRMPVFCSGPVSYGIEVEPWNAVLGSDVATATDQGPALTSCDLLPFAPTIAATPTTKLAANPSGLDFELNMPGLGLENLLGQSEAQAEKIEVSLPEGMTANASLAEGLATCSQSELKRETASSQPGEGCPEAAKIGTVELETPLLEGRLLKGSVYVATPYENPSGSLIALYLTIREPKAGVLVTQSLEVKPDPTTGQLITVADDIPQLPFSQLRVHLRSGGRPPLISPPRCGAAQTTATFYPYSVAKPATETYTANIVAGPTGGACPSGTQPFAPGFEAGSMNAAAGHYAPFYLHLTRKDGEQEMTRFSTVLPAGVLGKLAGLTRCSDAAIARAAARTGPHGAAEEIQDPSCPASSKIGRTLAGAGAGPDLTYVPGSLYLAGPLRGDPLSVVAITPAKAGPFDVGTVVVREALTLNPQTTEVEVDGQASDPIPHILKGVPLSLRDLRVYADRPDFTLNPTSCAEASTRATLFGSNLNLLSPSDDIPVHLSSRYQAADCASLAFKPKLALKLKGATKRARFPALHAAYTPKKGHANLKRLSLLFPHSEFIEQGHFRTICTRVQFAAGAGFGSQCPKGSIYGRIKAWTPLLDEPLQGPVFLRSSNHNLPDAIFALHGIVDIEVAVRIDSVHGRLRATVANAPDAPVSRAIVDMQGGQKGLFVNSTNLCIGKHRARANLTGQNGRQIVLNQPVQALGCKKAKRR